MTAIANPQATSSGSVTNQAVQVLQGPYITNSYGGGVTCQGPTLNITPFLFGTSSGQTPFETFIDDDGDPLTPMVRSGQKDNWSLNPGISATISVPLDSGLQQQCREAAETWTRRQQIEGDKARLDLELVRLLRCGEALQNGIMFHPQSPYAAICADVVLIPQPVADEPALSADPVSVTSRPSVNSLAPSSGVLSPTQRPVGFQSPIVSGEGSQLLPSLSLSAPWVSGS